VEDLGGMGSVTLILNDLDNAMATERGESLVAKAMEAVRPLIHVNHSSGEGLKWRFTACLLSEIAEGGSPLAVEVGSTSRVVVLQGKRRYVLDGLEELLRPGAIGELLASVEAKRAKPYFKSVEPPAIDPDPSNVTVLVGKTFESIALDPTKDVLVEFYVHWCQHCQELEPVYEDLAMKAWKEGWWDRGVRIAKMDTTQNECEEEIDSFPTMVLYPAVKSKNKFKKKKTYKGKHEIAEISDFVMIHSKNLDGFEESQFKKEKTFRERELERQKKNRNQEAAQEVQVVDQEVCGGDLKAAGQCSKPGAAHEEL